MTKPRLTKHQFEVYSRIVRATESRKAVATSDRVAAFSSRHMPNRVFHELAQLRRSGGPTVVVVNVGNAGALQHLEEKGYLRILIKDATTPVYVLADDEPIEPKFVREYFTDVVQRTEAGATSDGTHDHPVVFQVFTSERGWSTTRLHRTRARHRRAAALTEDRGRHARGTHDPHPLPGGRLRDR